METLTQLEHNFIRLLKGYAVLHTRDLMNFLGISNSQVRVVCGRLRDKGYKVCSGRNGYWLTDSDTEIEDNLDRQLGGRIIKMSRRMRKNSRLRMLQTMYEMEYNDTSLKTCNDQIQV